MENEKQENKPAIDILDVEVGEDKPQIEPKRVVIEKVDIEDIELGNGEKSKKIVLKVKHPAVEQQIDITGAKYEQGGKIKKSGLWYKLDNENRLPYNSAISYVLRHYKKKTPREMVGEQIDTVADESGYLLVKAY